jgi:DMSO reductase family type II enzyme heme b subunit
MYARRLQANGQNLLDPDAPAWADAPHEDVALAPTPLEAQPTRHIRRNLAGREWGACKQVDVRALHDGQRVYFRLEWADASPNERHEEEAFPDAAALLFPVNGGATLETMGSPEHPVNAWFWRPDIEASPENLIAKGIGTVERVEPDGLESKSARSEETWKVVLARPIDGRANTGVKLEPGRKTLLAVAVWEGSSQERAGIKAYSQTWREMELER